MTRGIQGIRHLVFDIDGTLVKIPVNWSRVLEEVEQVIGYKPQSILPILRKYYGTPTYEELNNIIERYEEEALNNIKILDNSPEIIRRLAENYNIYMVTMQSRKIAEKILERLGITSIPRKLVSRNNTGFRIDQLRIILEDISDKRRSIVFIGDKVLDMIAAFHVGVKGIMVVRDYFNPKVTGTDDLVEDLETLGVKIIWSLGELPGVLHMF